MVNKDASFRGRLEDPQGKRILVVGFARSGRAALDFFQRRGAVVTVSDSRPPWAFAREIPELLAGKVGLEFGEHGLGTVLRQDFIVVSPGVPWDLGPFETARKQGIAVMAEVEAAGYFLEGTLVGITGSNGKTTTTSLIGSMLEASGFPTIVAGNIGAPLIGRVNEATSDTVTAVELSSFQLEGIENLHPHVAVMLNVTANHLDRHPSFEAYLEAKVRIFRNQTAADYAVLNADDSVVMGAAGRTAAHKIFFSRCQDLPEGLLVSEGQVLYRVGHLERELFSVRDVKLRGDFNLENVLAASAAACALGVDFDALAQAVREFHGVEHRLEHVGDVIGIEFYNDSKATSVDATVKALTAFERGVHLILGGKDKGAPYAPLIPLLQERVRDVLVIGAAAERITRELAGAVEVVQAGDLASAVHMAFNVARSGDVILLSPACSSYDQFHDFEERGRVFKEVVETLAEEAEAARERRDRFVLEVARNSRAVAAEVPPPGPEASTAPGRAEVSEPPSVLAEEAEAGEVLAEPAAEGIVVEAPTPVSPGLEAADDQSQVEVAGSSAVGAREIGLTREAESVAEAGAPSPPDRIYIYELDAQELRPLDIEFDVPVEEAPLLPCDAAEERDTTLHLKDELFPFEIPVIPAAVEDSVISQPEVPRRESQTEPATPPARARRPRKKRVKESPEEPTPGGDEGGGRLPGM